MHCYEIGHSLLSAFLVVQRLEIAWRTPAVSSLWWGVKRGWNVWRAECLNARPAGLQAEATGSLSYTRGSWGSCVESREGGV